MIELITFVVLYATVAVMATRLMLSWNPDADDADRQCIAIFGLLWPAFLPFMAWAQLWRRKGGKS